VIVIGTGAGREDWWRDCLASLQGQRTVLCSAPGYELGKIRWAYEHLDVDRFWFLQDSVVVHNPAFLDEGLQADGPVSLCMDPALYGMYMGVYDRHTLRQVGIPEVNDKPTAIRLEVEWTRLYCEAAGPVKVLFPDLADRNAVGIEHRHGRDNLVLRNESLTKYKGTWG
jgi:hypothetical protein